ncbi:MAG: tyrosine-type recombinase/integrase [Candidatus Acidiferrales bacterium]
METQGVQAEPVARQKRRERGSGRIWLVGNIWWIQYYSRGRQVRESSRSKTFTVAERKLKRRIAAADAGLLDLPNVKRLRYESLRSALLADYRTNGRKSLFLRKSDKTEQICGLKHLDGFFAGYRAVNITTDTVRDFVAKRQAEGAANSTINRSLAALRSMFFLAKKDNKLRDVPHVPMLKEPPARKGFLEYAQFQNLRQALPEHLRPVVTLGFYTGMRLGEIKNLKRSNVSLLDRQIHLDPGTTKNDEARAIPLTGELPDMLKILLQHNPNSEFVFTRDGNPLVSFRKAWVSACIATGLGFLVCRTCGENNPEAGRLDAKRVCPRCGKKVPRSRAKYCGLIFHDLRRTGVRNLVRASVPERVAMAISGHKTRAVFERYNIVSERDLNNAGRALENYLSSQNGANSGQVKESDHQQTRLTQ